MKSEFSQRFDPRNRVISFRLSDVEYAIAQDFCRASGCRGMSMLARSAFLAYLPNPTEAEAEEEPALFKAEIKSLHAELSRLIASLTRLRENLSSDGDVANRPDVHDGGFGEALGPN